MSLIPWNICTLATDIFHFEISSQLLVVDYYSRFSACASYIFRYSWPDTLVSDNKPCYTAVEFMQVMDDMDLHHITSSPKYQQPNGLRQNYFQLVKSLLFKAKESSEYPYFTLMLCRKTPLDHGLQSPMELLCGRQARSDLPISHATRMEVNKLQVKPHLPHFSLKL